MKEFIDKLIGRLEEKFKYNSEQAEIYRDGSDKDAYFREKKDLYMDRANTYGEVMRIVNRLAEEYSANTLQNSADGWIDCSEELPEEDKIVLLCTKDKLVRQGVRHISYEHNRYDLYGVTSTFWDEDIVAWMPLPAPYKE